MVVVVPTWALLVHFPFGLIPDDYQDDVRVFLLLHHHSRHHHQHFFLFLLLLWKVQMAYVAGD